MYFEFITCLPKKINNHRPIPLYNKANWSAIQEVMSVLHEKMSTMEQEQHTTVEEMWQLLKTTLLESVEKHIPHRTARKNSSTPWISPELCRLIRKRDPKYRQMKKQGTDKLRAEGKELMREVQKLSLIHI